MPLAIPARRLAPAVSWGDETPSTGLVTDESVDRQYVDLHAAGERTVDLHAAGERTVDPQAVDELTTSLNPVPPKQRAWWLWGCAGLLLVAVLLRIRRSWLPLGDNALTWIWTNAVGGPHTPLVGGDARFGWNHLGPWLFYLLAIPYRLLGRSPRGLLIGAGLINIGSVVVIARCVRSIVNDWVAAVFCGACVLYLLTAPGPFLVDPWNPSVGQLLIVASIVTCWAVVVGEQRWLPWMLATGSVATQAHIAFLPPFVALCLVASASLVMRRTPIQRRVRIASIAVVAVGWAPTMLDLVLPKHHNLAHVAYFFVAAPSSGPRDGLVTGLRVVLRETGLSGGWFGGTPPLGVFTNAFDGSVGQAAGLGLVALLIVGIVAWRRHDRLVGSLVVLLSTLLVVAVAEMGTTRGPLFPYLFGWVTALGMMCWLTIIVVFHEYRPKAGLGALAAALPVGAAIVMVIASLDSDPPLSPLEHRSDAVVVDRLVTTALPALESGGPYRLVHGHDAFNSIFELGVVASLRDRGVRLVVDPSVVVLFGRAMVDPAASTYPGVTVVVPFYGPQTGQQVLALSDPLSAAERTEERQLTSELTSAFQTAGYPGAVELITIPQSDLIGFAGFVDPDPSLTAMLGRLSALRGRGPPVAVVTTEEQVCGPRCLSAPVPDGTQSMSVVMTPSG